MNGAWAHGYNCDQNEYRHHLFQNSRSLQHQTLSKFFKQFDQRIWIVSPRFKQLILYNSG
ncbi:uncharacterized protein PHALS_14818 [Plasmopara halstedii]|uniref:Uncharacterized protein n=1 Tax=Plasmopara halstedii TaxID=4781 RepID=A0A0P1AWN8_PLAHL|nr:uncharacterized protein PHALS_14818 [Plasmopara halstedii]CEG45535.1 hypothetical protein PHALS_14818 [Plasmopara halstedii]|eukprot:XP_024581904.1 hypothetical protein PHALS_14818 [Plasmopara halstedii]